MINHRSCDLMLSFSGLCEQNSSITESEFHFTVLALFCISSVGVFCV